MVVDAKNLIFQIKGYRDLSSFPEAINQIAFAHVTHLEALLQEHQSKPFRDLHDSDVRTLSICEPQAVDLAKIRLWLEEILWDKKYGMDVYRCKGVLSVQNSDELHTCEFIILQLCYSDILNLACISFCFDIDCFKWVLMTVSPSHMSSTVSTSRGIFSPPRLGACESLDDGASGSIGRPKLERGDSEGVELLSVSWNRDYGCFVAGTSCGFRIYNCEPFKETFRCELKGGGFKIVEMLFRCNILALVGSEAIAAERDAVEEQNAMRKVEEAKVLARDSTESAILK
ncbi:hypothetical protein ACOSP7_012970 [Xanthoceras sorbifolium]